MKKKQLAILIGIVVILMAGGVGAYLFYLAPWKKVEAEPVIPVIVPEHFARYADALQLADQKVLENPQVVRDGTSVTLQDLRGFFQLPLKQNVVYQQLRAPGDPRDYRKGIHQGIDFYDTKRGDPVYPAAPGVIIRIDKKYQPMEKKFRDEMLRLCLRQWNGTPGSVLMPPVEEPYGNVLDKLSGRQVILYHGKNAQNEPLISLYAHLSEVNHELAMYDVVDTDTLIGYIGNSGTSGEVENNPKKENHLHLEIFVGGMYWTPKDPSEIGKRQSEPRYTELQKLVLQELTRGYTPQDEELPTLNTELPSQP